MAARTFKQFSHTLESNVVKLYGYVVTTTSGAVDTTNSVLGKGFTLVKTAGKTGRYSVTLQDKYNQLLGARVMVVGTSDTAYTTAKGAVAYLRNVNVSGGPSVDIQFAEPETAMADAEIPDGAGFYIELTLKNSALKY